MLLGCCYNYNPFLIGRSVAKKKVRALLFPLSLKWTTDRGKPIRNDGVLQEIEEISFRTRKTEKASRVNPFRNEGKDFTFHSASGYNFKR